MLMDGDWKKKPVQQDLQKLTCQWCPSGFVHVVTSLLQTSVSRLILPAIFEHAGVLENGRHPQV